MIRKASAVLFIALMFACGGSTTPAVREAVLAGSWYPAEKEILAGDIALLLSSVQKSSFDEIPIIAVLPHAGYPYSGAVAAAGYAVLKNLTPDLIVVIGPPHRVPLQGAAVHCIDYYKTPLGKVIVARGLAEKLASAPHFSKNNEAFAQEHCIEIQLPFLQTIYGTKLEKKTPILPVLIGDILPDDAHDLAVSLSKIIGEAKRPLVIVSTDFTHYGPRFGYLPFPGKADVKNRLKKLDGGAIDCVLKKDPSCLAAYIKATDITVCGRNPLLVALSLPFPMGKTSLIKYDTSCAVTGECGDSVSYAAILIGKGTQAGSGSETIIIPANDRRFLLTLARKSIAVSLAKNKLVVNQQSVPQSCRDLRALFVTLTKHGELRGCIGTIYASSPLWRGVIEYARHAAFADPRFPPVTTGELDLLRIEISVLTQPRLIASPAEIVIGRDGLIIELNGHRGLLLPQVAVEYGWTVEEFLVNLCRKAGLPNDAWRNGAALYVFQALVFGEEET